MPYTLQQARANQDEAKCKADEATDNLARRYYMNDVMFWTGYLAAMIDWDCPPTQKVESLRPEFVNVPYRAGQEIKLGGNGILDTNQIT